MGQAVRAVRVPGRAEPGRAVKRKGPYGCGGAAGECRLDSRPAGGGCCQVCGQAFALRPGPGLSGGVVFPASALSWR